MMMMTLTASASALDNAFDRPGYRHNHSLRYQRFMPRTCPECARIYRMRHGYAPRHHRGPAYRHAAPRARYDRYRAARHHRNHAYKGNYRGYRR